MRVGYPVYAGHGEIAAAIPVARGLGFGFVDIAVDEPGMLEQDADEICRALEECEMAAGVQSPWESVYLGSVWEECVEGAESAVLRCAEFARAIGAEYLNVHLRDDLGVFAWQKETSDRLIRTARDSLQRLRDQIQGVEVVTAETTPMGIFSRLDAFSDAIRGTGVAVSFDIGHVLAAHDGDLDMLSKWGGALADVVVVAHLSGYRPGDGAHFEPTPEELDAAITCLRPCPSLEFVLLEFFKGFEDLQLRDGRLAAARREVDAVWSAQGRRCRSGG
ncbi:hypothetical protein AMJ39_03760 [candidate division TA06 bacterium DG_24]|uniref:Xylose isomerase-like TIM barrel domain-containing protein n=3 Tax=Bacteria division TA06 TaxID=1156500 RepID=A0A0S8JCM8_UNCT6|nr:MAG: hypothetical protein AMJ39_03760 [candidate division TA06 bacterium DG_24]KPK67931.1 MAG: hypothetical protein AMJ82_09550 [candidate division TA06 bacterium SM23_40]KPL06382.1 MAG: hypothetical protein AMJ71_09875 [candidate division TA06 bacterium SM1_40]